MAKKLSASLEDYLEAIAELCAGEGHAHSKEIAEKLNVSIYYLSHVFKTLTGATVIEYRNELRLTKSKQLLLHTDKRIGEIALEVGFSNVAYFSEIFSRSEKISPSQYRNLHQMQGG